MHNDTALPVWALEVIERQPYKSYVRLRDLPDQYFNKMKEVMPKHRYIDGKICITHCEFVRAISRLNIRAKRAARKQRQSSKA